MALRRSSPRILLVEGKDELRLLPELLEKNGIAWGLKGEEIVQIKDLDGVDNLLAPGEIEAWMASPGLEVLGIIVDADEAVSDRWRAVRERCSRRFPELPAELPDTGLIVDHPEGLRLGIWIMPDNRSRGMLETFLNFLIRDPGGPLIGHARQACESARALGAPFRELHADKAHVHSWLAWQDPPGRQLHDAVKFEIFDPRSPHAAPFVAWFRSLFRV